MQGERRYEEVIDSLRQAYDGAVEARRGETEPWKVHERWRYLELLRSEGRTRLLELGAGTGVHGKFFRQQGLDVVCTDLSPEMVAECRREGLEAYEMDFLSLNFPTPFSAAFAMNCLLHVPKRDFGSVLSSIQSVLEPGALFYLGQYGGSNFERVREQDTYVPKRFFASWTDEPLQKAVSEQFEVVDFRRVDIGQTDHYFQALILRRPSG
jgi:SAM-dependent methyltransferase